MCFLFNIHAALAYLSTKAQQDSIRLEANDVLLKNFSAIEVYGHAPLSLFWYTTNQTRAAKFGLQESVHDIMESSSRNLEDTEE